MNSNCTELEQVAHHPPPRKVLNGEAPPWCPTPCPFIYHGLICEPLTSYGGYSNWGGRVWGTRLRTEIFYAPTRLKYCRALNAVSSSGRSLRDSSPSGCEGDLERTRRSFVVLGLGSIVSVDCLLFSNSMLLAVPRAFMRHFCAISALCFLLAP